MTEIRSMMLRPLRKLLSAPRAALGPLVLASALAAGLATPPPARAQACDHFDPLRQPFFGDVHVHSVLSFDAYLVDTRVGPRDAYRFAKGEAVGLPPLDAQGNPTRVHQLRVPLDFAAVSDHAEMLGETALCAFQGWPAPACQVFQGGGFGAGLAIFGSQFQDPEPERLAFCGEGGAYCLAAATSVWSEIVAAADEQDDPTSECGFSAFAGYEWTATPGGDNLHRNVIFRGLDVPALPPSYVEVQTPTALWTRLQDDCAAAGGDCEALTIPHNSNESAGMTFLPAEPDGSPMTRETALLRERMEPLVELIQHKGDSECRTGVGTNDERCGFEKIFSVPPAQDAPLAYVRNVLKEGLAIDARLGVNPFALGLIGSSDTHNGTPGATSEDDWPGHVGSLDADPAERLSGPFLTQNPGGLMVLWAEENERDALFDAMQRRESYATSGTRPTLRFFGGFDLPAGLCDAPDLVAQGYANGVPMGGRLAADPAASAPRFVVAAAQDPGAPGWPGTPLAEVELVKGWLDANGVAQETVVRIAGGDPPPDAVDPLTCTPSGWGASGLCAEWVDPDFDPDVPAFYYVRLHESPTCRWSTRLCRDQGVDCTTSPPPGFEACCDGSVPETIQERATSSPVWIEPVPEPGLAPGLCLAAAWLACIGGRIGRRAAS